MRRTIREAVFDLLLALPGTEEARSHGAPTFKVGGKTFAYWTQNHHGDERVSLWLGTSSETQAQLVALDPETYFIPPYVGVKGWTGMDLGMARSWDDVRQRVLDAWTHCAPPRFNRHTPGLPDIDPPTDTLRPEDINPMLGEHAQAILKGLAAYCLRLPETQAEDAHASATWRAGKKPFVRGRHDEGRLKLQFLVGPEQQALMLDDPRCALPPYYGNAGWIELDVQDAVHWPEIESLLETGYRRVALKRMLRALDGQVR